MIEPNRQTQNLFVIFRVVEVLLSLLTLNKIKLLVILLTKKGGEGIFRNNRENQFGTSKLGQNHTQVCRTKVRNTLL